MVYYWYITNLPIKQDVPGWYMIEYGWVPNGPIKEVVLYCTWRNIEGTQVTHKARCNGMVHEGILMGHKFSNKAGCTGMVHNGRLTGHKFLFPWSKVCWDGKCWNIDGLPNLPIQQDVLGLIIDGSPIYLYSKMYLGGTGRNNVGHQFTQSWKDIWGNIEGSQIYPLGGCTGLLRFGIVGHCRSLDNI